MSPAKRGNLSLLFLGVTAMYSQRHLPELSEHRHVG